MSGAQTTARLAGYDWTDLEFEHFHRVLVPDWLAQGRGQAAARDVAGKASLALCVDGRGAFTYVSDGHDLTLYEGSADAGIVAVFSDAAFREFACEAMTAPGLFYTKRVRFERGDTGGLMRWEPALRCLYTGRPIFDRRHSSVEAGPERTLAEVAEQAAEVEAQLAGQGYVLIRSVFSSSEVAALRKECEKVRGLAEAGDPRTWWGRDAKGADVCTRVNYAGDSSPDLQGLFEDRRIQRIAALCGPRVRPATDRLDGVTVIFKTPEMREGLSDLPWHIDCGTGGHPVMCPLGNLSIHLDDVNEASGDLRAIPGSHRGSNHTVWAGPGETLGVSMGARAGDCTLHYGDLCHAAPPPQGEGPRTRRVSIVLTYPNELLFQVLGPRQAYNDALLGSDDGQIDAVLKGPAG